METNNYCQHCGALIDEKKPSLIITAKEDFVQILDRLTALENRVSRLDSDGIAAACPNATEVDQDNLLILSWKCPCHGYTKIRRQLPSGASQLVRDVQEIYFTKGPIDAVKHIKDTSNIPLNEAIRAFKKMQYGREDFIKEC